MLKPRQWFISPERMWREWLEGKQKTSFSHQVEQRWYLLFPPSALFHSGFMKLHQLNRSVRHAAVVHGKLIFFQANNLVLHTAVEHFWRNCRAAEQGDRHQNGSKGLPHIITSNVEHDSIKLVAEHLQKDGKAGRRPSRKNFIQIDTRNNAWLYFNN